MKTLIATHELRVAFRTLICETQLDLAEHLETYREKTHKAIKCDYCDTTHLTLMVNWKTFLQKVNDSSAPHGEKNLFIHNGLSQTKMRNLFYQKIENNNYWKNFVEPILVEQSCLMNTFRTELCSGTYIPSNDVEKINVTSLFCVTHGAHEIVTDVWEAFVKKLNLNEKFSALNRSCPPIIKTHAAGTLNDKTQIFVKNFNPQNVFDEFAHAKEKFFEKMCKKGLNEKICFETSNFKTYTFFYCLKCRSEHFVRSTIWDANVNETKFGLTKIGLDANKIHLQTFKSLPHLQKHVEQHPAWDKVLKMEEELTIIQNEFTTKENILTTMYVNKLNSIRLRIDELNGLPELVQKLGKRYILRKIHLIMKDMYGKDTHPRMSKEFLLPVEQLTDEQLIHYYKCGRKVSYATETEAIIGLTLKAYTSYDKEVYRCDVCFTYHYGENSKMVHSDDYYVARGTQYYVKDPKKANKYIRSLQTNQTNN